MLRSIFVFLICVVLTVLVTAQDKAIISGALSTNANVFLRDSSINAINTPQYDRQFFGGESWLNLNYSYQGFTVSTRFDMFNNSNLRNPTGSFTGIGIGRWHVKKTLGKLDLQAGYIYDQIGSGLIFRSFETRPLFIDNAMYGVSGKYNFSDSWNLMGFIGRQKDAFDVFEGSLKGLRAEGFISVGDAGDLTLAPGVGLVMRTISDSDMEGVVNAVRSYLPEDRFIPNYNAYSGTIYNLASYKGISLYTEVAVKSNDAFYNPFAPKQEIIGTTLGKLEQKHGTVLYGSLSVAEGNLGVTIDAKRTENFNFRIDPNLRLLRGLINYLTPVNRQNTYRLTARYSPAPQDISEMAYGVDIKYKFSKAWSTNINFSDIKTIDGDRLFQELFTEVTYKKDRLWRLLGGLQLVTYNQEIYEMKSEVPLVKTIVPYADFLYRFDPYTTLRTEFQYMDTKQDFGSWMFGLLEYSFKSAWIVEVSGMYNINPKIVNPKGDLSKIFYPTAGVVYSKASQRYSLRYVKQVEGIVCSGGICRLEPAFSGVRFSLDTTF